MKSIYKLLFEGDEDLAVDYVIEDETGVANAKLSADSVDYQIDQFLIKYEKAAIEKAKDMQDAGLNESLNSMSLKFLMTEQEGDPFAEDEGDDPFAEDEGGEDEAGGEEDVEVAAEEESDVVTNAEIQATEPAEIPQPPINIDTFVTELNRLLAMPQNILSLRQVILNRAKNYLAKNYTADHVEAFEIKINEGPYKITKTLRPGEPEGDEPLAVGAYAGGTGGLGGGG